MVSIVSWLSASGRQFQIWNEKNNDSNNLLLIMIVIKDGKNWYCCRYQPVYDNLGFEIKDNINDSALIISIIIVIAYLL